MYCKKCGLFIDNDSVYCSKCGVKQSANSISFQNDLIVEPQLSSSNQQTNISNSLNNFDPYYNKETNATIFGVIFLLLPILIWLIVPQEVLSKSGAKAFLSLLTLVIRIFATVWVVNIAERQNRIKSTWGFFAFFFPSIALIIIGQTRKLKKQRYSGYKESSNSPIFENKEKQTYFFGDDFNKKPN